MKIKTINYFFLILGLSSLFCFILGIFFLTLIPTNNYQEEQFWWFFSATSLLIVFFSGEILYILDKENKQKLKDESKEFQKKVKIVSFMITLGMTTVFLITIINMYLKSFLSYEDFTSIMLLKNPIGLILFIIFWIGVIILGIGTIMMFQN